MNFVVNYEVSRCFSPGGGGGGFFTSGRSSANFGGGYGTGGEGGKGFLQGGEGGRAMSNDALGGFCGGRGVYRNGGGAGGGGGYSWGASGDNIADSCGGGGGSYNSGDEQSNDCCFNDKGHKFVFVTWSCRGSFSTCFLAGELPKSVEEASSEFFQLYSERTHSKSNKTLFERVFLFKGYSVKISRLTRVNDCT